MLAKYAAAEAYLNAHRPVDPVRCLRPFMVERAAAWFQSHFCGQLIYAVKANPSAFVIESLSGCGVERFDVASLREIELVSSLVPEARLFYMNPVKSRAHIRAAYFDYGVRRFAVDDMAEAAKIIMVTEQAKDLTLYVRLSCNDAGSVLPLGRKYGAAGQCALDLLRFARKHAAQLGVTFHVGSQALMAERFGEAIGHVADLVRSAGIVVERLNVGGGFPIYYKEGDPLDLGPYLETIGVNLKDFPLAVGGKVFAEPGRALVAEAESLIVRVDGKRGNELFINDGGYGVLFDAAHSDWVFPARLIKLQQQEALPAASASGEALMPFSLWGPTCDAADRMPGPFYLPADVAEGDYLEIYKTGAYGWSMSSQFNGFGTYEEVVLQDEVVASNYQQLSEVSAFEDVS